MALAPHVLGAWLGFGMCKYLMLSRIFFLKNHFLYPRDAAVCEGISQCDYGYTNYLGTFSWTTIGVGIGPLEDYMEGVIPLGNPIG